MDPTNYGNVCGPGVVGPGTFAPFTGEHFVGGGPVPPSYGCQVPVAPVQRSAPATSPGGPMDPSGSFNPYYPGSPYTAAGPAVGTIARTAAGVAASSGVLGDVVDLVCRFFPETCNILSPGARFPTPDPRTPAPTTTDTPVTLITGRPTGQCPPGYHLNKSTYWTKQGVVFKGTRCVKNRRMNPTNPRALARAVRRGDAFVRLAKSFGLKPPERGLRRSRYRR